MPHSIARRALRPLGLAVLTCAIVATAGCGWFRKGNALYAESPEARPLEVPPELDLPDTSGAMRLPDAGGSVARSDLPGATPAGNAQTANSPAAASQAMAGNGFAVAAPRDAVFERLEALLGSIDGLAIASKAQLLGSYDVDYAGEKFLVRVSPTETGSYVSAVDPRGLPAGGEGAARVLQALEAGLAR
jgi:uncharacterized lipoprotein